MCLSVITVATQEQRAMTFNQATLDFLEKRGLDPELAARHGWYTAEREDGDSVLIVPYFENGKIRNAKFRKLPKQAFWQLPDRAKLFWNADVLRDPALEDGRYRLVITEGEIDGLTSVQ